MPGRVISSYTPTLAALARARAAAAPSAVRQLTVGMPATPGLPPLPAVPAELAVLARHFPPGGAHQQITAPLATRAAVLAAVADLATLPGGQRDLAFLSACETATGSVRHLDEAIHLAAALQFLGFRHIVATLWTIADSPAPRVADRVYTGLSQPGGLDPGRIAGALHEAAESLRGDDPTDPVRWAPYVHVGP